MTPLAITLAVFASAAAAHDWYEPVCCSGRDCVPVRASAVVTDGGWLVRLGPADHPMLNVGAEYFVPYDDFRVRPSQDDRFHVCISNVERYLLCLYVPEGKG